MTNAELIKALRYCGNFADRDGCDVECPYINDYYCPKRIMCDAADALEAAEKRIDGLQKLVDINTERCEALRKQLREAHESYEKHINELTTKCNQLQAEVDNYEKRIAELEAQLPKEGEWIEVHDWLQIPQEERGTYRCSACGQVMKYPWNYRPNCGARMRTVTDCHTFGGSER